MKKVGQTTRAYRHDLNQIHYDYTVEVTNRFKGLDLIDRVPEKLWTEIHNIVPEVMRNPSKRKKKCKKAKRLPEEPLQIVENRREVEGKGERESYTKLNAEFRE